MEAGGCMPERCADPGKNGMVIFYAPEEDSFTDGAKMAGVSVDSFKQALTTTFAEAVAANVGGEIEDTELMRRLLEKLKVDAPLDKRTEEAMKRALYAAAATTVLCFRNRNGMSEAQEGLEVHPCHDSDDDEGDCEGQVWSDWSPESSEEPGGNAPEVVGDEQEARGKEARGEEVRGEEVRVEEVRVEEVRVEEVRVEEVRVEEARVEEARVEEVRVEEARVPVEAGAGEAGVEQCANEACEYTLLHNISGTSDAMNVLYKAVRWDGSRLSEKEFSQLVSKMNADACTVKCSVSELRKLEKQARDLTRDVEAMATTLQPAIKNIASGMKKRQEYFDEIQKMKGELASMETQLTGRKREGARLTADMEEFRNGKKRAMAAVDPMQKWAEIQMCIDSCQAQYPDQKQHALESEVKLEMSKIEEMENALEKARSAYDAREERHRKESIGLKVTYEEYTKDAKKYVALVSEMRDKWAEVNNLREGMVNCGCSLPRYSVQV